MNVVIDTNVLCALLNEDDVHHEEAKEILLESEEDHLFIPAISIAEALMGPDVTERSLDTCKGFGDTIVYETERELTIIADYPYKLRKQLKAIDCLILAFAATHNAQLWTFDQRLQKTYQQL